MMSAAGPEHSTRAPYLGLEASKPQRDELAQCTLLTRVHKLERNLQHHFQIQSVLRR